MVTLKKNTNHHILALSLFTALALFLVFIAQPYFLSEKNVVGIGLIAKLPLPAGFVGITPISLNEYYLRLNLANNINSRQSISMANQAQTQSQINAAIFQQLAANKVAKSLSAKYSLIASSTDIDTQYNQLQQESGSVDLAESYGLTQQTFKQEIILPQLIKQNLAVWLSSNQQINSVEYRKLAQAQAALSAQIGGDLGFVSNADVLPEMYSAFASAKDSKPHIANSRLGIHLFEVLGTDNKGPGNSTRYHVRQIFIKTTDFDQWFAGQMKNYAII